MFDPNRLIRGTATEIAPGVYYAPALLSNLYFVGDRNGWVMVDAGTPGTANRIRTAVESTFEGRKPNAIVLTHGHFDHVGALRELSDEWDVPVFAHPLELPFLDGRDNYPPPDPTVGGFMAQLSRVFPKKGINVGHRLRAVMIDNTVPSMPGWRVIQTPGHSPGHISLFRDSDRTLIAGDAVITIDQDHAANLLSQKRELHAPPVYFTIDWDQAAESIGRLAQLRPRTIAAGHGLPMSGEDVADKLTEFAAKFRRPSWGRYVDSPALADEQGIYYVPPASRDMVPMYAAGAAVAAAGLMLLGGRQRGRARASAPSAQPLIENRPAVRSRLAYDIFGRRP